MIRAAQDYAVIHPFENLILWEVTGIGTGADVLHARANARVDAIHEAELQDFTDFRLRPIGEPRIDKYPAEGHR